MKVILLQDIPKIGQRFDVKTVADGYARNFLLPRKLAELATTAAEARLATARKKYEAEMKMRSELLAKNLKDLAGKTITMEAKANEQGHLFAGISNKRIAAAVKKQTSLDFEPDLFIVEKPIKEVGEHKVGIKDSDAKITINVEPLGE